MRQGCLFYDLGSLICDPYVTFEDGERNELLDFYYELMKPSYNRDEFVHNFWMGSVQRLLQALGAYGFLGLKNTNRISPSYSQRSGEFIDCDRQRRRT